MSFIVLHMDKFKKEAVRGIQSHNERERESHSNHDINYERSGHNYELHEQASGNYTEAIQNRIDDLLLVKAVRKDAVYMCGLIVSSDSAFFEKLSPEETKRFFEESKAFLMEFVGAENVISAKVHLDEKTPHMHFLHVPVTPDGRLNAKGIYTRESLKMLQTELPRHLQSCGFDLQRGIEQEPGAKKKHLNTREFKQQQEALASLEKEAQAICAELEQRQRAESALQDRLQSFERQALEPEKTLSEQTDIPKASILTFKSVLATSQEKIELQKQALAGQAILSAQSANIQEEVHSLRGTVTALHKKIGHLETEHEEDRKRSGASIMQLSNANQNLHARLEETEKFFRWNPEANQMHLDYIQEQRQEAQRKAAEKKRLAQERELRERQQQVEKERQAKKLEQQKALEVERQKLERDRERQQQRERRPRGMGMGR